MILLSSEQPMWTDQAQAWASLIGIAATIIGITVLLIRDKHKDDQIQRLSNIADNLSKMATDNERRYIISKKPQISVASSYLDEGCIGLIFTNSNVSTSISDYEALESGKDESVGFTHQVQDKDGKQKLFLNIPVENVPFGIRITMKYYTTEGFTYFQYLTVMMDEDYKVFERISPISHEDEIA